MSLDERLKEILELWEYDDRVDRVAQIKQSFLEAGWKAPDEQDTNS